MNARPIGLALIAVAGALATLVGCLGLAAQGVLPDHLSMVVLPAAFVALLATLHALIPASDGRIMVRRAGFWLLASAGVIGLPSLGTSGLFDPWEAHYGEVAREMIARGDAVSTFWAHEGWFTSKPVLLFWLQALSLQVFGLHAESGRMLEGFGGRLAHPEWALRVPMFAISAVGLYVLYKGFSLALGRRAAVAGALAVATSTLWVLLARQSTTDMPLVGFMSASMGLTFAALNARVDSSFEPVELSIGRLRARVHPIHGVVAAVLLVVLPQATYLVTRNIALVWEAGAHGFAWRADLVRYGSTGNCTLPGQIPCSSQLPHFGVSPLAQGLAWLGVALALCLVLVEEKRRPQVLALAAWVFAALATMAKGPAGLVLPLATAVTWAVATGNVRALGRLAPLRGLAIVALLVLPWYVATWMRHGRLFVDELVLRHMVGRTLEHLHDTNAGDDVSFRYYLAQLGLALLPWSGLAILGFARALRSHASPAERFLAVWAIVAFALVTAMRTKFHHYAFPVVPPLAMLAGISLSRPARRDAFGLALLASTLAIGAGFSLLNPRDPEGAARLIHLFTYQYARTWPAWVDVRGALAVLVIAAGVGPMAVIASRNFRVAIAALALMSALLSADVVFAAAAPHWGQRAIMDAWMRHRTETEAPLAAYRLNWKGENFYTGNRLALFGVGGSTEGMSLSHWIDSLRERGTRRCFVATERTQLRALRAELGGASIEELTTAKDSGQFVLVRVER